jgi:hypothetical protein
VLLIKFDKHDQVIQMERWEHVPSTRPRRRFSPAYHPQCQQRLVLNGANGQVDGAPLVLPASLIYDVVPLALASGEFSFGQQVLADFAYKCFS